MSDKVQIHGLYENSPDAANESISCEQVKAACFAAVVEWPEIFTLDKSQAEVVSKVFDEMQAEHRDAIRDLAENLGLNDAQRLGLTMAFGHGGICDAVDELRGDQHPALRQAYQHTVQRILNHNTLFGTLMHAHRTGALTDPAQAVGDANAACNLLDNGPMPYEMISDMLLRGFKAKTDAAARESAQIAAAQEAYDAVAKLLDMLPDGHPARSAAENGLEELNERFGVGDPVAQGPDGEDGPWADGWAERAGLGNGVEVERIEIPKGVNPLELIADKIQSELPAGRTFDRLALIKAMASKQSGVITLDLTPKV